MNFSRIQFLCSELQVFLQGQKNLMMRVLGYLGGLALFLALGLAEVTPRVYYLVCFGISLLLLGMVIIFRILAKHYNGFWMIWSKRYQSWISKSLMCLARYVIMPQFNPLPSSKTQQIHKKIEKPSFNQVLGWGILNFIIGVAVTGLSPAIFIIVALTYSEALYRECSFEKKEKVRRSLHEEEIARNTARMPIMQSYGMNNDNDKMESSLSATDAKKYPLMDSNIRQKAISASNSYPNNLLINPYLQEEEKKEKREHSQNLSTNFSRDIPTEEAKQILMSRVQQQDSQLSSQDETRKEIEMEAMERKKEKGNPDKRTQKKKISHDIQEEKERSTPHGQKQQTNESIMEKVQLDPHNHVINDQL